MASVTLLIILVAICVVDFRLFDKEPICPALVFAAFFGIAVVNGLTNYFVWDFDLHWNTVAVIGGGAAVFSASCYIVYRVYPHVAKRIPLSRIIDDCSKEHIEAATSVPWPVYVLGLVLTGAAIVCWCDFVMSVCVANGGSGNIIESINQFDQLSKFSTVNTEFRGVGSWVCMAAIALGYIWVYLFAANLAVTPRRFHWLAFANVIASFILPLVSGGRTGAIMLLISGIVMFVLFQYKRGASGLPFCQKRKYVAIAFVAIIGALGCFYLYAVAVRGTGMSAYTYLSYYLGAPIKNLDMYLNDSLSTPITVKTEAWGEQTLSVFYQFIAHINGDEVSKKWLEWQPYQTVNGVSLGNVYTTYYTFIFDWGFIGAFIATAVMGSFSQWVYCAARSSNALRGSSIKVSYLVYGIMAYGLAFCYFLNFYAKEIVSTTFAKEIVIWLAFSYTVAFLLRRKRG